MKFESLILKSLFGTCSVICFAAVIGMLLT